MNKINEYVDRYLLFPFKLRRIFAPGVVGITLFFSIFLYSIPLHLRIWLSIPYGIFLFGFLIGFSGFVTTSITGNVFLLFHSWKNKPEPSRDLDAQDVARKMGIRYDKPIYITDNPRANSAYTDLFRGRITIPRNWLTVWTREQLMAAIAHELGHLKRKRVFIAQVLSIVPITFLFSYLLSYRLPDAIVFPAECALFVWLLMIVLRRNETMSDREGAKIIGARHMISLLRDLSVGERKDEGSETHPSLNERINDLEGYFFADRPDLE